MYWSSMRTSLSMKHERSCTKWAFCEGPNENVAQTIQLAERLSRFLEFTFLLHYGNWSLERYDIYCGLAGPHKYSLDG